MLFFLSSVKIVYINISGFDSNFFLLHSKALDPNVEYKRSF
jgi:hypothetical protein